MARKVSWFWLRRSAVQPASSVQRPSLLWSYVREPLFTMAEM